MQELVKLISEILRIKETDVTDELSVKTAEEWDSLKHMELIVGIEETFKIKLTTNDIVAMVSVKEINRVLKEKGVNL